MRAVFSYPTDRDEVAPPSAAKTPGIERNPLTKHSKFESERRAAETVRTKEIEAAWMASVPAEKAKAFRAAVEAARSRPPAERPPDMAPGTPPRPPRPGFVPRVPKEERNRRPRD